MYFLRENYLSATLARTRASHRRLIVMPQPAWRHRLRRTNIYLSHAILKGINSGIRRVLVRPRYRPKLFGDDYYSDIRAL